MMISVQQRDAKAFKIPNYRPLLPLIDMDCLSSVDSDAGAVLTTRKRGCSKDSDSDNSTGSSNFKRATMAISNPISILSLNSDVLLEIFEHACSTPATILRNVGPKKTVAPALVLSQVCRSWRTLAIARPRLWSSLCWGGECSWGGETFWVDKSDLDNTDTEEEDDDDDEPIVADERLVHLWDLYLSRSGKYLLNVSLSLFQYDVPKIREHLLNLVFVRQDRLMRFRLYCEQGALPEGKAYLLDKAPRLAFLEIEISEFDPELNPLAVSRSKAVSVDLSNLGSLRNLSLSGDVVIIGQANALESLQSVSLNHNNVAGTSPTALALLSRRYAMSPSGIYSFLSVTPNICWLESAIGLSDTVRPSPQRLLLRDLRRMHLTLQSGCAKGLNSLFENLELPKLWTLAIIFYDSDLEGFRWWTKNSTLETLTELHLTCDCSHNPIDEDLRGLLLCTPGLQTLTLHTNCISPQTLSLLTLQPLANGPGTSNLCPELEKLFLMQSMNAATTDPESSFISSQRSIVDLISSRWRGLEEREVYPGEFRPSCFTDCFLRLRVTEVVDGQLNPRTAKNISSFIEQGLNFELDILP
ncbi:hypothetical protein SCHPADRAFT_932737 [Schizopora paradoxa]|uniref:F-box domain-containing protein n=1 Tax=Schizopora paradoxa TaxID=27342 RepID=A0A0H2RQD5_9AGAM|nr:hypothetical protein SCHPADRAFT_932737 [Schizopora paradoxa]